MFTKPHWRLGRQQDDYNLDLEKAPSTPTTPLLNPEAANHRFTAAQQNREESVPMTRKKAPFYAKKIIIVVLVIVIITVAVGGVVGVAGGTREKMSLNSRSTLSTALSSTTSSSTQGGPGSVNQGPASRAAPAGCMSGCNDSEACCGGWRWVVWRMRSSLPLN